MSFCLTINASQNPSQLCYNHLYALVRKVAYVGLNPRLWNARPGKLRQVLLISRERFQDTGDDLMPYLFPSLNCREIGKH
jgi:hypothetical protein